MLKNLYNFRENEKLLNIDVEENEKLLNIVFNFEF